MLKESCNRILLDDTECKCCGQQFSETLHLLHCWDLALRHHRQEPVGGRLGQPLQSEKFPDSLIN